MARIDYGDGVTLDSVCVVPFVSVRHIVVRPSADSGAAAWQRALDGIDGEEGIAHVTFHVLIRVSVAVLLAHISVEGSNLGGSTLGVEILILHLPSRR